jgi:RimJ/RimL family protein N-acetyltransferase
MILQSARIQLEPLQKSHYDELFVAAQNEAIWTYSPVSALGDKFSNWFEKALQAFKNQEQLPFVVRSIADKKIIGSTRYYHMAPEHRRLTIGYTWYIPEVWGTYVNPECKYLLLKHAFEDLKMNRVEFVIDTRNTRSQAAVKKLGASEEGILRQHMILSDGFVRDSKIYSIIMPEWSRVKSILEDRLK